MKPLTQRVRTDRVVAGIALLSCVLSVVSAVVVGDAEAQRGRRGSTGSRRGRGSASAPAAPPQSAGIAPALDRVGVHWGMNPHDTFQHFSDAITEDFRPRIAKATGAIEEDRLRAERDEDIRRIRASYIRFRGQASGWDTSFLRDEYTAGNNESMMVVREDETHSTSHYFFINDHLWKRYQAFDASAFPGATFDQFAQSVQGLFGQGAQRSGSLVEGRPPTQWIEWQDATTRLRAVDQTRFYGFFCLVFEERAILDQLSTLRAHTIVRDSGGHALVDSILRDDTEGSSTGGSGGSDDHADIADRLSGHTRHRTDAADTPSGSSGSSSSSSRGSSSSGSSGSSSGSSGSSGSGSTGTGSSGHRVDPDDPFAGMDL
jgi:hypothetical protein